VLKVHSSIHSVLLQWVPGGPEAGRDGDGVIVTSTFHLMAWNKEPQTTLKSALLHYKIGSETM